MWLNLGVRKNGSAHTSPFNLTASRVSAEKFAKYVDLANAGVSQYWSRSIKLDGEVWTVHVNAVNSPDGMSIDLADPGPKALGDLADRSFNAYPRWTGTIYYDSSNGAFSDAYFARTAAHEIGHGFLTAAFGTDFSWRHEGTSDSVGNILKTAPYYPPKGEIGLMPYYHRDPARAPAEQLTWPDLLYRSIASENDVKTLLYISGHSH